MAPLPPFWNYTGYMGSTATERREYNLLAMDLTFNDRCDECGEIGACRWARTLAGLDKVVCGSCLANTHVTRHYLPLVDC